MTTGDRWLHDEDDPHSTGYTLGERCVRDAYFIFPHLTQMTVEHQVCNVWFHAGQWTVTFNIPPSEWDRFKEGVSAGLRARVSNWPR